MRFLRRMPLVVLVVVTALVGAVMIYFGIRGRGYRPVNGVKRLSEGLIFKGSGMAYTDDFFGWGGLEGTDETGLTIEMVLRCEALSNAGFRYVLSVSDGTDARQLLLGQWLHWLIVMNGDDYDGRKGVGKIYVDLGTDHVTPVWITIVSDARGTRVFLNGRWVKSNSNLHLFFPSEKGDARLVLGSSAYGRHAWQGEMRGLGFYDYALDDGAVRDRFEQWQSSGGAAGGRFEKDPALGPKIVYRFGGAADGPVANMAGEQYTLMIPERMRIFKREFLRVPDLKVGGWAFFQDVIVNFMGFMPLGILLHLVLHRLGAVDPRWDGWVVVGVAFVFSLTLEVAQAWIPSRDSSLQDLVLNTLGAGIGVWGGKRAV